MDRNSRDICVKYEERPGLFHISLNASQFPQSQQLTHRIEVMKKLIQDFPDGFTRQAARNLLGVLYFYNSQFSKAVHIFNEILKSDPNSLTATANLAFVYQRMKQNSKASEYSIQNAADDTGRQGIALAEQGFAFIFDCHVEKDVIERNNLPMELLVKSLTKLKKSERPQDVMEIQYWLGQTYYRLFTQCPRRKGMENIANEFYTKGVEALVEVTKLHDKIEQCTSKEFLPQAWAFLGLFLSKRGVIKDGTGKCVEKTIEQMDDAIKNCLKELELYQYLENPEQCFSKGLEYSRGSDLVDNTETEPSTELLNRYAIFLKSNQKYKEALSKLNQSLDIDNGQGNWFSWILRADVLFKLDKVDEAIEDWEKACSWHATPKDLCELAKAYQVKYKSCKDTDKIKAEEYLLNASNYFVRAVQCLGQEKRPEIYRAHGRFLREIGEVREAIESFKRAMEVDTANKATVSFCQLFETLLQFYKKCVESDDKSQGEVDKLLHEMAYFYDVATRKHGQLTNETKKFIKDFEGEMTMLTAYFKHHRNDSSFHINGKSIDELITSMVETENVEKWNGMVEKNVICFQNREEMKKSENTKEVNLCPKCKMQVGYTRQLSAFPIPPDKPRSLRYPYDFYVIFSPPDRDWVCHVLLQTLEVSYGYKGAVAERDTMPGTKEVFERVSFIQNCPKILVILRQEFENYPECSYELAHAVHRMTDGKYENLVIPICRTVNGMHQSLKTITYLDAVGDCDWNKLIKALELN
ncbi:uncharacterized protein LOC125667953 [Ostrea edulis]|uniref:uncharacterized protein LOC125667953 n=1 Tax=Ostrea edulis TaxID=37623 RepID=UPI0024AFE351|nr:uncharacterized protein LOC125667953 [Ostrea edulis]